MLDHDCVYSWYYRIHARSLSGTAVIRSMLDHCRVQLVLSDPCWIIVGCSWYYLIHAGFLSGAAGKYQIHAGSLSGVVGNIGSMRDHCRVQLVGSDSTLLGTVGRLDGGTMVRYSW